MSADRFDDLAKALATGTSRRRVLKAMAATVAGGAVAAFLGTRQTAEAIHCGNSIQCPGSLTCINHQCRCPTNTRQCGTKCCSSSQRCVGGSGNPHCVG